VAAHFRASGLTQTYILDAKEAVTEEGKVAMIPVSGIDVNS
jgi:hypothetical protein